MPAFIFKGKKKVTANQPEIPAYNFIDIKKSQMMKFKALLCLITPRFASFDCKSIPIVSTANSKV
jgi:hypothetical protein